MTATASIPHTDLRSPASGGEIGVGALIRRRRGSLGWTLQRVADRVGCAKSYLCQIENARVLPPASALLDKLEAVLGFPPGMLVSAGERERTPESVRGELARARQALLGVRRSAARLHGMLAGTGLEEAYRSGRLRAILERALAEAGVGVGTGAANVHTANLQIANEGSSGGRDDPTSSHAAGTEHGPCGNWPLGHFSAIPLIGSAAEDAPGFTELRDLSKPPDEHISVPGLADPEAFAVRLTGDLMEPAYRPGDIVVFSPRAAARSGMDCFVRLRAGARGVFVRIYLEASAPGVIRLQPVNGVHAPRVMSREELAGIHPAVTVIRRIGEQAARP